MKKIVLIQCCSTKQESTTVAEKLYCSPLFKYSLKYAKSLNPDRIYILSALHHVVELSDILEPYNLTLNTMSKTQRKFWSFKVLYELKEKGCDLENDFFIILAGTKYRDFLISKLRHYSIPLKGLGIGRQLSALKKATE